MYDNSVLEYAGCLCFLMYLFIYYLQHRVAEIELPIYWFTPIASATARTGPGEKQDAEVPPTSPTWAVESRNSNG